MFEVIPKGWFSKDYEITNNGERIVDIHQSWFREEGELTILGEKYQVRKPSMRSVFLLEQNGVTVARAEKPSAFKRTMFVDYNGVRYTLRPESIWRRRFVLQVGDQVIGSIERRNGWSRKVRVQLPDLSLPVTIFMTWLVIMLWRRDDAAVLSAATSTVH